MKSRLGNWNISQLGRREPRAIRGVLTSGDVPERATGIVPSTRCAGTPRALSQEVPAKS